MKPENVETLGCVGIFVAVLAFPLVCYHFLPGFPVFAASGLAAAFIVLLMLIAGLILRKAKPRTRTAVTLGIACLVAGVWMGTMYWESRPSQIFKRHVVSPIPDGVLILEGVYGDSTAWLHFTVDHGGALQLLETIPFDTTEPGNKYDQRQLAVGLESPEWWRPWELNTVKAYQYSNLQDRTEVLLYTNNEGSEAYYHCLDY